MANVSTINKEGDLVVEPNWLMKDFTGEIRELGLFKDNLPAIKAFLNEIRSIQKSKSIDIKVESPQENKYLVCVTNNKLSIELCTKSINKLKALSEQHREVTGHKTLQDEAIRHILWDLCMSLFYKEIIKENKQLTKKLTALEKEKKSYPMSRNTIEFMTATQESERKSLNERLKLINKEIKGIDKKKEQKGKLDYLQNIKQHAEKLLQEATESGIDNKLTIYEKQAIFAGTKLLNENNWNPVRFCYADIVRELGFKTTKGSIHALIKEAMISLSNKPFRGINLYKSGDVWLKEPGDPLFEIRDGTMFNLQLTQTSQITSDYCILSVRNKGFAKEATNWYINIPNDIWPRIHGYFKRIDEFQIDLTFRLINKHHTYHSKKSPYEENIIQLMLRCGDKESVLNESKTDFKDRKARFIYKKNIKNVLEFLKTLNYVRDYSFINKDIVITFKKNDFSQIESNSESVT